MIKFPLIKIIILNQSDFHMKLNLEINNKRPKVLMMKIKYQLEQE